MILTIWKPCSHAPSANMRETMAYWDDLAEGYCQSLPLHQGRPTKEAQLVIAAVIIKLKLCLSDRDTVAQIQENSYLQYFAGLPGYQMRASPFAPAMCVEIRKPIGQEVFKHCHGDIIEALELAKQKAAAGNQAKNRPPAAPDDDGPSPGPTVREATEEPSHQGKLILDATVCEQAIRYPTDLSLRNGAREFSERIIDKLYSWTELQKNPRKYSKTARKANLTIVKRRHPGARVVRRGIWYQLQNLRRNLRHIEDLLEYWPLETKLPLPRRLLHRYWVMQHLYAQQRQMYDDKSHCCDDRIVSLSQPHVWPIIGGKRSKSVEFGGKLSVSLSGGGMARVDRLRWDAFHEGLDLKAQVQAYCKRYVYYPEKVLADPLYGMRDNRSYLKSKSIHFAGNSLGRPKKVTDENRLELKRLQAQRREDYRQRIPIEGKFGQGKSGYWLNYIRARRPDNSAAWINGILLVMDLLILLRFFFGRCKKALTAALLPKFSAWNVLHGYPQRLRPDHRVFSQIPAL